MTTGRAVTLALLLLAAPPPAAACQVSDGPWRLFVRGAVSGSSHDSEPAGYVIYSGVGLDVTVARSLAETFWLELSLRTESREVEGPAVAGFGDHLGSLEMLPVELTLQWHPLGAGAARWQPYVGAGLGATLTWEKSGVLDTTDPPPALAPVAQLGMTFGVGSRASLSVDGRWSPLEVRIEGYTAPAPRVEVDPLRLGVGIGLIL